MKITFDMTDIEAEAFLRDIKLKKFMGVFRPVFNTSPTDYFSLQIAMQLPNELHANVFISGNARNKGQ